MAQRLDALVARLAPSFACPVFQAHLTVQGDLAGSGISLEEILRSAGLMSMEFELKGIGTSSAYFRSFYLEFCALPDFCRLQKRIAEQTGTEIGLAPFPHVSLAYGEPPVQGVKELLRTDQALCELPRRIRFDRLALVRSSKNVPIEQWAVQQVCKLP